MPYSVLIVDDEPSSIRYIKNLIEGYLPEYQVMGEAFSGIEAKALLERNAVDLLITDARMPGMDGIELSRAAREMSAELKIVVVSGYADFEYAKGALSAGVNEYLLKPLNIERALAALREIAARLDVDYVARRRGALSALLSGAPVSESELTRLFGGKCCRVGLARLGNLPNVRGASLHAPMALEGGATLTLLHMRDGMEFLGVAASGQGADLSERLWKLCEARAPEECATIVFGPGECPLPQLPALAKRLSRALDERLVIGRPQIIELGGDVHAPNAALGADHQRKLDFCLQSGNMDLVKDTLFCWAVDWEERALPQRALEALVSQITERALSSMPGRQAHRQQIRAEVDELFVYARNAGELMGGLWDVLFAPLCEARPRQGEAGELIEQICTYLRERCAEPITMQVACAMFGVSQTYLSRLFRRHKGTTFNEFLTSCRLDTAKRLIREQPGVKLRDVAALCGYEDPSYFSKVFRQHEGITPQQFASECGAD